MVRAVGRALSILEAFDTSRPSLALRDICEHTGIAKATAFRLIKTLEHAGYLVRLENQRLCLAPKLVRLAGMVPSTMDIRDVVRPVMLDLSRATGETVSLNTCSGWERVCVDSVNTPSPLMTVITPGEHAPLVFGALGKILLAFMDDKDVDEAIVRLKGGPPVNRLALKRQLRKFRSRGFSFTRDERIPGGSAIAVPLFDLRPQPKYGNVTGLDSTLTQ